MSNNSSDNEAVSKEESREGIARMKKGPWTLSEDIMLREYVMKYGEGNWNSVQKNSELARCGKSCRLRWANHLRPNLKKSTFSKEEEHIIVQLHAKLGNKWARMAAQLPGRTDNEIKNFWNTRVKRYQRAGLPLYPPEVLREANLYHLQQQCLTQHYTPSSFSFSSLLSSPICQKLNELSYPSTNIKQNQPDSFYYSNPLYPQFKFPNETSSNGNMSLPLSPISPYVSSSSSLFNQSFNANNSHDYRVGNYNNDFHSNVAIPSSPYESIPLLQSSNTEATSLSQSPPSSTTPTSSYASVLLEALVAEPQNLCHNDNSKTENSTISKELSHKRKNIVTDEGSSKKEDIVLVESANKNYGNTNNKIQRVDSNSFQFSTGNTQIVEDGLEGINSMDDDLFGLLNNFQEMLAPDWYHKEGEPLGLETQQDASLGHTN